MVADTEQESGVDGYKSVSGYRLGPSFVAVRDLRVWRVTYKAVFYKKNRCFHDSSHEEYSAKDVLVATTGDSILSLEYAVASSLGYPNEAHEVSIERAEYLGETI